MTITPALKALANKKNENLNYVVSTAADFLRQLYLEVVITDAQLIDPRDALVFELMKVLTTNHSATIFVRKLKEAIQQKFSIIPLHKEEILRTINVWVSQSFMT